VNSGFSGLLWSPEVRDAGSVEELVRRLQTAIFSSMALINAWYIRNPPWKQVKKEENNRGQLDPNWKQAEGLCREAMKLRMRSFLIFMPLLCSICGRGYHLFGPR
jgi:alpha-D-xyloside xylohydrolase